MDCTRILIIDDHPLFREGLKSILHRNNNYRVVGEASNGNDGLRMAKSYKPNIAIVDISLPDMSGIQLTHEIRKCLQNTRVIVVSMHSEINYVTEAFQSGATGYVAKESASEHLLQGLASVVRNEYFLDSSISHQVVENIVKKSKSNSGESNTGYSTLTPREQEIMRLLAEGLTSKEIAARLFISPKTVANHRTNIFQKLGVHNAMELVRYAARLGLIDVGIWKTNQST